MSFLQCDTHCSGSPVGEDLDEGFDGDCEGALGLRTGASTRLGASAGATDSGRLMGDQGKEHYFGDAVDFELGAWPVIDGVFSCESERASRFDPRGEDACSSASKDPAALSGITLMIIWSVGDCDMFTIVMESMCNTGYQLSGKSSQIWKQC